MAHTEARASPAREFQLGVIGGCLYGATHTFTGHPLDNIKARLQMDKHYLNLNSFQAASKLWAEHGIRGYFQGCLPPLVGSTIYRAAMLSSYEWSYTWLQQTLSEDSFMKREILNGYLPRPMVFTAAVFCSLCRSLVEAPFEYAKVMLQTDQKWKLRDAYRGLPMQTARTCTLLLLIFGPYDVIKQKTDWGKTIAGQWAVVTVVSGSSYAIIWPLETLKNLAQAGLPNPGATIRARIESLGGLRGLYRGAGPGIICGGFRNGMGMLAMVNFHRFATTFGLRKE